MEGEPLGYRSLVPRDRGVDEPFSFLFLSENFYFNLIYYYDFFILECSTESSLNPLVSTSPQQSAYIHNVHTLYPLHIPPKGPCGSVPGQRARERANKRTNKRDSGGIYSSRPSKHNHASRGESFSLSFSLFSLTGTAGQPGGQPPIFDYSILESLMCTDR